MDVCVATSLRRHGHDALVDQEQQVRGLGARMVEVRRIVAAISIDKPRLQTRLKRAVTVPRMYRHQHHLRTEIKNLGQGREAG